MHTQMSTLTYIAFFSNRCVFANGIDFHMVGEIEQMWYSISAFQVVDWGVFSQFSRDIFDSEGLEWHSRSDIKACFVCI